MMQLCFKRWLTESQWMDEEEPDEPEPKVYRPGQLTDDGDTFEPERQPDLSDFMVNKTAEFGSPGESINGGTGYLLPDGRTVQLGGSSSRAQDHRFVIPSTVAIRRWGWPAEIVTQREQGTDTPAMREMMRRTGAIRLMCERRELFIEMPGRPSNTQKRVLSDLIREGKIVNVILSNGGRINREMEPFEFLDYIDGL